ncbi:hypothetical protein SteCoe_6324 [Stentor coeruleus]|uniref:Uncharacterized protein n=1 Tax=Stentor coeruleus TaxID=5963 RepID=A0A1R2CQ70_9CILI|nr:hypothetical protein SteCoe_6324 [Stentor coeruleus]
MANKNLGGSELMSPDDMDYFIQELQKTESREVFNSAMKRFEDSYLHRYKTTNPPARGKFPFGSAGTPAPEVQIPKLSQPYSYLGSFYQREPQRVVVPEQNFRKIEELYTIPMHERGVRSESPMHIVRTEYVPYPYPMHPPYEYVQTPPAQPGFRRNPLQESMDLRKVKEDLFYQSVHANEPQRSHTPLQQYRYEENYSQGNPLINPQGFRSFYSKK